MTDLTKGPESFSEDWCSLGWTPWVPFGTTSRTLDAVPDLPGIYRIRAAGQDFLMYIGSTTGSLRECFAGIRQSTSKPVMPQEEPWPVAPALWAWRNAKRYAYEFSAAPVPGGAADYLVLEWFLAYRYRQEQHESPLCSFGRFHRRYRPPESGAAGRLLGSGEPLNPAGGPSASPLPATGRPGEPGWMGLSWSPKRSLKTHTAGHVPPGQGYFLIHDALGEGVLAIRRSENCAQALFELSRNPWDNRDLAYSYYSEPRPLPLHNLRERECDLIGNYLEQCREAPACQFRDEDERPTS